MWKHGNMETLGVQNSSFELESAFFTLLVEEKGKKHVFISEILVFGQNSIFLLPVEEKARAEKIILCLGDTRGKGQSPAELNENPGPADLTGNLWDQRTR